MKKLTALIAAGMLVAAIAGPASAGKAKKLTFHLHGNHVVQEAGMNETWLDGILMTMDTKKPAAGPPKSMFVTNYVVGPNTACSGNGLLPVWRADMKGTITGDVTVMLHTLATPATKMTLELYPDGNGGCDSELGSTGYVPPVATETIEMTPGHAHTKVVFKNVKANVEGWLLLQLYIADNPHPGQVRILYDSADFDSTVQLSLGK